MLVALRVVSAFSKSIVSWLVAGLDEFRAEADQFWVRCLAEKKLLLIGLTAMLGGLLFRLLFLGRDVRFDEALTFTGFASQPFLLAISDYSEPNNHILHTIGVWIVMRVYGIAPEVLRIPALLAGLLLIPACGLSAAAFYGKRAFGPATVIMAFLPCWVAYSVNARGYTLQALFFALALGCSALLLRSPDLKWPWIALVGCASLAIYTVPTSILIFFTLGLWMLLQHPSHWRKWIVVGVAVGLIVLILYSPVFLHSGWSAVFGNRFVTPLSRAEYWSEAPQLLRSLMNFIFLGLPKQLFVLVPMLLAVGFLLPVVEGRRRPLVPLALFFVVVAIGFSVSRQVLSYNRIWLYLTIPMIVGVAGLIAEMVLRFPRHGQWLATAFLISFPLACVGSSVYSNALVWDGSGYREPDASDAVEFLGRIAKPGQHRIAASKMNFSLLTYYMRLHRPELEALLHDERAGTPIYVYVNMPEYGKEREALLALDIAKRRGYPKLISEVKDRRIADFKLVKLWSKSALFRIDPLP